MKTSPSFHENKGPKLIMLVILVMLVQILVVGYRYVGANTGGRIQICWCKYWWSDTDMLVQILMVGYRYVGANIGGRIQICWCKYWWSDTDVLVQILVVGYRCVGANINAAVATLGHRGPRQHQHTCHLEHRWLCN